MHKYLFDIKVANIYYVYPRQRNGIIKYVGEYNVECLVYAGNKKLIRLPNGLVLIYKYQLTLVI